MKQFNKNNLGWLILIALMAVVLYAGIMTNIISPFYQITLVTILLNIILAIGLNLVIGFSGQFSLGHAGFMAIGAYSGAVIGDQVEGFPGFLLGLLVGMIISVIVALIVGIPTLRLKGDYLAIATLGIAEIIRILILNMGDLTNGARGISGISFPFAFQSELHHGPVCFSDHHDHHHGQLHQEQSGTRNHRDPRGRNCCRIHGCEHNNV